MEPEKQPAIIISEKPKNSKNRFFKLIRKGLRAISLGLYNHELFYRNRSMYKSAIGGLLTLIALGLITLYAGTELK